MLYKKAGNKTGSLSQISMGSGRHIFLGGIQYLLLAFHYVLRISCVRTVFSSGTLPLSSTPLYSLLSL